MTIMDDLAECQVSYTQQIKFGFWMTKTAAVQNFFFFFFFF